MVLPRISITFKQKDDPDDYERVLASLSLSISSAQTRLSEIRLRERRSTLLVTLYAIGFWMLYVLLWWTVLPRYQLWPYHSRDDRTIQGIIKGVPAFVGPIFILFIRRLVQLWYARKGDQEEKQLKALMAEQRTKIEEIKKKTNYYSTKNLLDRYDDSPSRKQPIPVNGPSTPVAPGGLRQRQSAAMNGTSASGPPPTPLPIQGQGRLTATTPNRPSPLQNSQLLQPTPQQLPPPQKQWFDKVVDALLGEENESSNSKFALICENCFNHNGLVKEAEFDDMKYVCPKCGHFNRSPKQKRELEEKHARGGHALRAVNRNQESPPPTAMSSFPNSPEPYRSRFGDQTFSGLSNIPASPSPSDRDRSSSRSRATDEDGDAEMRNAADNSVGEVDMDKGAGPAIKVD